MHAICDGPCLDESAARQGGADHSLGDVSRAEETGYDAGLLAGRAASEGSDQATRHAEQNCSIARANEAGPGGSRNRRCPLCRDATGTTFAPVRP
jgi:hypothetical protein